MQLRVTCLIIQCAVSKINTVMKILITGATGYMAAVNPKVAGRRPSPALLCVGQEKVQLRKFCIGKTGCD